VNSIASAEPSATPSDAVAPGYRWYALATLTLVYTLSVADRFVVSTIIEPIKHDLGLTDAGVGFLTGAALAIFYAALGLPVALYADRANRRNLIAISLSIWSVMTAVGGITQSYWQLLLARVGVGIGEAGGVVPANSIIADLFPWRKRALAFTIFALGSSLGSMLGSLGGFISDAFGWRSVFFVFGIPGIVLAIVLRLTIVEPDRGGTATPSRAEPLRLSDTVRLMLARPALRRCLWGISLFGCWGYGLMWWTPAYLMRSFGLSAGEAGGLLLPIHGIGGTIAVLSTGWLMLKIGQRDPRQYTWFMALVVGIGTIASMIAYFGYAIEVTRTMLWIFIPCVYMAVGPFFSLIQNMLPPDRRAQGAAIAIMLANIGNLIVAPQLVGLLSDVLAPDYGRRSLQLALFPVACSGCLAAYFFWSMSRTLIADMRSAGTIGQEDAGGEENAV
jgi:predicted MFS family arabinose efflux permease